MVWGDSVIAERGILSRGILSCEIWEGIVSGGILSGGIMSGGIMSWIPLYEPMKRSHSCYTAKHTIPAFTA